MYSLLPTHPPGAFMQPASFIILYSFGWISSSYDTPEGRKDRLLRSEQPEEVYSVSV